MSHAAVVRRTLHGAQTKYARNVVDLTRNDILATKGAALIDVLLIIGIGCAVLLADKVGI